MEKQTGSDQNDRLLLPDVVSIFVYNGQCKGTPLDAFKSEEDAVLSAEEIEEPQISDCIEEVQEFYIQIQVSDETKTKFCQDEWIKMGQEKEVTTMGKQLIDYLAQTFERTRSDKYRCAAIADREDAPTLRLPFYNMGFLQGVSVVAVLEDKSILPVNVTVPLATTDEVDIKESSTTVLEEQLFECFRVILSLEDLHRWLRLARLVALSRDEGQISKASWDAMLALESQQLARSTSNESTST
ncbi:hypothetical protein BBJ29_004507 [Phytophthora kernoviae]|uniref:Uncharacterized protein n=1 Tax=Phytophthora kernoviae TaxID=325452 RepID=A0A421FWZ5_9STRA|nr:hypothetical protein BBJ29_004507 [Phytophthora kernoviae]